MTSSDLIAPAQHHLPYRRLLPNGKYLSCRCLCWRWCSLWRPPMFVDVSIARRSVARDDVQSFFASYARSLCIATLNLCVHRSGISVSPELQHLQPSFQPRPSPILWIQSLFQRRAHLQGQLSFMCHQPPLIINAIMQTA